MQNLNQGYNNANQQTDISGSDMPTMRLRMDSNSRATENLSALQVAQMERAAAKTGASEMNPIPWIWNHPGFCVSLAFLVAMSFFLEAIR